MNEFWKEMGEMFVQTQVLRDQMMETLTDSDLALNPGGENSTLGDLCWEMGGLQYTYIQSFKTFRHDWTYPATEPGLENSVEKLKTWFKALDHEMNTTIQALSDEDVERIIVRSATEQVPARVQAHFYREALFIFYGRASVYLRTLCKIMSAHWEAWID